MPMPTMVTTIVTYAIVSHATQRLAFGVLMRCIVDVM